MEGTIGGNYANKWKGLVHFGLKMALEEGHDVRTLNSYLPANVREGIYTKDGYSPIHNFDVSVQGMDSNKAAETLVKLAKKLNCELDLNVLWGDKSPLAGQRGVIRWPV